MTKKLSLLFLLIICLTANVKGQIALDSLVLWLRSDSGVVLTGASVTQWNDLSGKSNHASQANPSQQPTLVAGVINDLAVVRFDGGDLLNNPALNLQTVEIFMVAKGNNFGNQFLGFGNGYYVNFLSSLNPILYLEGVNYRYFTPIQPYGKYQVHDFGFANGGTYLGTTFLKINNVALTPGSGIESNTFVLNDLRIGSNELSGDIAEILVYKYHLPDSLKNEVHQYLFNKYAPPVALGPDVNIPYGFCDTTLHAGGRFTDYLWSTGDTTESITVNNGGSYWVSVTDIFGFTSRDTVMVNKPSLNIADTLICQFSMAHMDTHLGANYSFLWSDSTTNADFYTDSAGAHWVNVTDTLGCQLRDTMVVAIDSFPTLVSLGPDRSACRGEILGLAQGQAEAVSYLWSTGSGAGQILINSAPGLTQDYSVTVQNAIGCESKDTIAIFVRGDVPQPAFMADSVCIGLATTFTDLTTTTLPSLPAAWVWAFGDGDSSAVQNPVHVYPQSGIYNVALTVTTDSGCVKSFSKAVVVWAKPNVFFSPVHGCEDAVVPFSDHSTNTLGSNNQWSWDFGDAGTQDTAHIQAPNYTYNTAGLYTVTLIVNSVAGCSDTLQRIIEIKDTPEVGFSVSQSCVNQVVYFVDTTQTTVPTQIMERRWNFGDGGTSNYMSPAHTYDSVGIYNVSLQIKTLNGCTVTTTAPVTVYPVPIAVIGVSTLCDNVPGQLIDLSTAPGDSISAWFWNFGEDDTSSQQNPWFTPDRVGPFNTQLIVWTPSGCSDTTTMILTSFPLPTADFSFSPEFGTAPLTVDFTNLSTGASSWLWDFGGQGSSTQENPEFVFNTEGVYPVTLFAYSIFGCPDSITQPMYVLMLSTDIAVLKAEATLDGDLLQMSARLLNNGTRRINELLLKARFNGSNTVTETWTGTLEPGEILEYTFVSKLEIPSTQTPNFACVDAEITGYTDDKPSNNSNCAVLQETFSVSNPYPNPVSGELSLDVILPFSDALSIAIYDETGKKMAEVFNNTGAEGYTRFVFESSVLQAGNYSVQVVFRDKMVVRKFVKQ